MTEGEPIDAAELLRIARKREELGRASLTEDERRFYHQSMKTMRPVFDSLSKSAKDPDTQEGLAAYRQMSPEEQERYGTWTPAQLAVLLPLIDDELADEDDRLV